MNGAATRRGGANGINVVLGIWLILSPFILGFTRYTTAEWNNIAVGIAVVLLALGGANLVCVLLGIWLIISPFVLGYAGVPTLLWNDIILGALIGIVAAASGWARPVDEPEEPGAPLT